MPGSGAWPVWPTYCQLRRKIRSCSRRATASSRYQAYGSVRVPAAVSTATVSHGQDGAVTSMPPPWDPDEGETEETRILGRPEDEPTRVEPPPPAASTVVEEEPVEAPPPGRGRELWPWLLLGLGLVAALLAALWWFSQDDDEPPAAALVSVPSVVRLEVNDAQRVLEEQGFRVEVLRQASDEAPKDIVFAQDPEAGTEAPEGSTVRITASVGPASATVPDVVGLAQAEAVRALEDAGLRANPVRVPSERPEGTVVAQSPQAGAEVEGDSVVRLNVSGGPGPVAVPDVTGLPRRRRRLAARGGRPAGGDRRGRVGRAARHRRRAGAGGGRQGRAGLERAARCLRRAGAGRRARRRRSSRGRGDDAARGARLPRPRRRGGGTRSGPDRHGPAPGSARRARGAPGHPGDDRRRHLTRLGHSDPPWPQVGFFAATNRQTDADSASLAVRPSLPSWRARCSSSGARVGVPGRERHRRLRPRRHALDRLEHGLRRDGVRRTASQPSVSPDGLRVAYVCGGTIRTIALDGSGAVDTGAAGTTPSWSPDGTKLVFRNGAGEIRTMNADGSGLSAAIATGNNPVFSPNGATIAFDDGVGRLHRPGRRRRADRPLAERRREHGSDVVAGRRADRLHLDARRQRRAVRDER